jgi:hypothetical protein
MERLSDLSLMAAIALENLLHDPKARPARGLACSTSHSLSYENQPHPRKQHNEPLLRRPRFRPTPLLL